MALQPKPLNVYTLTACGSVQSSLPAISTAPFLPCKHSYMSDAVHWLTLALLIHQLKPCLLSSLQLWITESYHSQYRCYLSNLIYDYLYDLGRCMRSLSSSSLASVHDYTKEGSERQWMVLEHSFLQLLHPVRAAVGVMRSTSCRMS